MERLTTRGFDYCAECDMKLHCAHYDGDFPACEESAIYDRLSTIEDILGDEYDLDRLSIMVNQRMTMREEVAERWELTCNIPLDRLRELAHADREGRIHIYRRSYKCPICGAYRLIPRVDRQFYFCFHCKSQVSREEAEAALRGEQE